MEIIRACVFPTATFGCESWTISKADEKRINAFEMKCYRRALRIPWVERVTNKEVLKIIPLNKCQLLSIVKKSKLSYFGHLKRHDVLERIFLEGRMEGRRGRGRPRRRWTQYISDWMETTVTCAGRKADDSSFIRCAVQEATFRMNMPK